MVWCFKNVWSPHGETVGLEDEFEAFPKSSPRNGRGFSPRRSNLITYNLLLNACDLR